MTVQPDPGNGARERGVALITVILIVALAASMAAFMAWQQQIWVRQVENLRDQSQAQAVARAAIDWARAVLADDTRNNNVDHLGEKWATVLAPLPVETGRVTGSVADQQGLFNLNNLVRNGKPASWIWPFSGVCWNCSLCRLIWPMPQWTGLMRIPRRPIRAVRRHRLSGHGSLISGQQTG